MAKQPASRPSGSRLGAGASKRTAKGSGKSESLGRSGSSSAKKVGSSSTAKAKVAPGGRPKGPKSGVIDTPIRKHFIDYPRAGRVGFRRWLPSWRLVLAAFLGCVALGFGAVAMAYLSVNKPAANDFATSQTSKVLYADGSPMGSFSAENRQIIDTTNLDKFNKAVVAAEDSGFWDNSGIDPKGIARAFYQNVLGSGNTQGASTITQQYVKNYYLNSDRTWQRKVNEAILAVKIDREEDKSKILDDYLNTIYFGRGAYGVQTAAQVYFGKDAAALEMNEVALLAGIIPSPVNWDPAKNPEKAEQRWNYVLGQLVKTGELDKAKRDAMVFPADTLKPVVENSDYTGSKGFLLFMVVNEFTQKTGLDQDGLERGGFTIKTTIDPAVQLLADEAIATIPENHNERLRSSIVAISPADGGIVALNGGEYRVDNQLNNAVSARAQAASTMKPFGLIAGLENGFSLKSTFNGNNGIVIEGAADKSKQTNFGKQSFGTISLLKATENSVNTAYMGLNAAVGPAKTTDVFVRATGIDQTASNVDKGVLKDFPDTDNNILGTGSVTTKQLATGFATFASQGVYHETHIISEITSIDLKTKDPKVNYSFKSVGQKVIEPDVMADATYAMTQVIQNGTGKTAKGVGRPVAGKTGSSNDNKAAWFAGFTPDIAVVVGLSQEDVDENGKVSEGTISPMGKYREITGSTVPLDVWTNFMKAVYTKSAFKDLPVKTFPKAANVGSAPPATEEPVEEVTEEVPPPVETTAPPPPAPSPSVTTPADTKITVPAVVGKTQDEAIQAFVAAGLKYAIAEQSSAKPVGSVLSTNPVAGTKVPANVAVTITVSKGPAPPVDPGGGGAD